MTMIEVVMMTMMMMVLTVCRWVEAAGHDAITQLDDLWHHDNCLAVVSLVRQQNQKVEHVRNQLI